ncbi:MAG: DUF4838 domain-containing protein [Kiritimatiellia bacterium]
MNKIFSLFLAGLISATAAGVGRADFEIVREGKPLADIVIAAEPPRAVKLAAMELQEYIFKISGAKLPVVTAPAKDVPAHIYVGKSAYTGRLKITGKDLKFGAFRMVSGKDFIILIGHDKDYVPPEFAPRNAKDTERWDARTGEKWVNPVNSSQGRFGPTLGMNDYDERGSLNAVYEFLRSLGVRWYMPGDLGEVVPEKKTIAIAPLDKTVRPDFPYRDLGNYSPAFWYGSRDALLYRLRIGLDPSPASVSDDWPHGLINVHGRKETKEAHPEYYALYDGKRSIGVSGAGYPCLSSTGLFESAVNYARAVFDIYPDKPTVGMMPQDAYISLCQCDLCKGKDTPVRGWDGVMSDYVWDFVNRVAIEVYKTHPDRKIVNGVYGSYVLPPEKIDKFSPNVMVVVPMARDPATREQLLKIRREYAAKVAPGNMISGGHYLHSRTNTATAGMPVFFPRLIAEDLGSLKGLSQGEFIELTQGYGADVVDMHAPIFNHLNVYVTARYYWDADQDINALLDEYYDKFYGPAAKEMKEFIEYSEKNWPLMKSKPEPIDKALELLEKARKAAGDKVYGKRVGLMTEFCQAMKPHRDKIAHGRKGVPQALAVERKLTDLKLDGRLDKPFWKDAPVYELKELVTGNPLVSKTYFQVAWCDDRSIVFGIRCEDADLQGLRITTTKNEDANIFNGDVIELQIETPAHAYYQVVLNPAGALIDLDRATGIDSKWSSDAKLATFTGDTFWSVEIRIPASDWQEGGLDPLKKINGKKPEAGAPWYFNVNRTRQRGKEVECAAFSPTGEMNFHVPLKFGELIVK